MIMIILNVSGHLSSFTVFTAQRLGVPAHFLERFLLLAREHEVMTVSDALEVLALWCKDSIEGGDLVLEKLIKISDMAPGSMKRWCPQSKFM